MIQGSKTAIKRKAPPLPLRWLQEKKLLLGRVLDYGCGHGPWFDMEGYDPEYKPTQPTGKFDTIVSVYVLNVVNVTMGVYILKAIRSLLKADGIAYVVVRRDLPKEGKEGRGTFQRYVELDLPSIRKVSSYEIYEVRK